MVVRFGDEDVSIITLTAADERDRNRGEALISRGIAQSLCGVSSVVIDRKYQPYSEADLAMRFSARF